MIIGVCGGSAAGKTTLVRQLAAHFMEAKPAVFSMDNYYLPLDQQARDRRGEVNFDLPTALDKKRLIADLRALVSGQTIRLHEYLFNGRTGTGPLMTIEPSPIIIIEGLFLFHYTEVASILDFSVFIDVDPGIQLTRRQLRDQSIRGCSEQLIAYQWEYHVTPCFKEFLLPYRQRADFFFSNEDQADQEFGRLVAELAKRANGFPHQTAAGSGPQLKNRQS